MKLIKKDGAASDWPDRMVFYSVLATTKSMLENLSPEESFFGHEANDALVTINQAIKSFHDESVKVTCDNLTLLYAPTGPIHEISMSNGWDKVYLKLAEAFDKTVYTLNVKI